MRMSIRCHASLLACSVVLLAGCSQPSSAPTAASTGESMPVASEPAAADADLLARGDYLVRIAGCNDCHTAGYAEQKGDIDRTRWLLGSPLGCHGPWGTTYASNLRLSLSEMDEAQWLDYSAGLHTRPIMPDFLLRTMHEDDRRAIYRFVRSLGPAGEPAPAYLPPGQRPPPPYMELVLPEAVPVAVAGTAP